MISHVLASEIGMFAQRLINIVNTDDDHIVKVHWRVLPESEDTLEPIAKHIYQDVKQLILNLLHRKNTSSDVPNKARQEIKVSSVLQQHQSNNDNQKSKCHLRRASPQLYFSLYRQPLRQNVLKVGLRYYPGTHATICSTIPKGTDGHSIRLWGRSFQNTFLQCRS